MNEPIKDSCQCGGHDSPAFTTRRQFLGRFGMGLGGFALAELLARAGRGPRPRHPRPAAFSAEGKANHLSLHVGRPSQLDLFDYKPLLNKRNGEQLPDSVRGTQRLTGMSATSRRFRWTARPTSSQHGPSGA